MSTLYAIAGGFGVGGILLALILWQLVRKSNQLEVAKHENAALRIKLEQQREVTGIFSRPRGDKSDVIDRL